MSEHFLDRSEVGASLQEMRGEGVPEEMGVDPFRLQAGRARQPAKDEESPGTRERPSLGVEEELGPVTAVEVRPAAGEVAAERRDRFAADRHDPLLRALSEAADEAPVEVDCRSVEADR